MVKNVRVGDSVYIYDGYVEKAEVLAVYQRDKGEYLKLRCQLMQNNTHRWASDVYRTQQECMQFLEEKSKATKEEYRNSIHTVEDLVKFLLTHNTDNNTARAVAIEKAQELLNLDKIA